MRSAAALKIIPILLISVLASCKTAPVEQRQAEPPSSRLSSEEQQRLALDKFKEMLDVTTNVPRHTVISELEEGYYTIIRDYPESDLAEESYWRLITMSLQDYYPPLLERAEQLYREYFKKYPNPSLNHAINNTMARFYYRSDMWEKLSAFCVPYLKEYVKTGKLVTPLYMYYYSEARLKLDDLDEAEKGYRIIVREFPNSVEGISSKNRLELIIRLRQAIQNRPSDGL